MLSTVVNLPTNGHAFNDQELKASQQRIAFNTLMQRDRAKNAVECADPKYVMIRDRQSVMRWVLGLNDDVATFLIYYLIPPVTTHATDNGPSAEVTR